MSDFNIEKENSSLNQYWYSQSTIDTLVSEIEMHGQKIAFLSCPSLFFALKNATIRSNSKVFEFDKQWEKDPGFVFYDYNEPEKVPVSMWEHFDYIVVDPPFITEEVWTKYAQTVKLLLAKGGKVLFTSVIENHQMLEAVSDQPLMVPLFRPSIPHLVYQYHCFKNYASNGLEVVNTELPPEDPKAIQARQFANDLRESQKEFANQVINRDREGETPLPQTAMKWSRIPDGLTEYANGASAPPPEEAPVDYGAEFASVEQSRNKLEAFKKLIDGLAKLNDVQLRSQGKINKGGDAKEAAEKDFAEAAAQRAKDLDTMRTLCVELAPLGQVSDSLLATMKDCTEAFATVPIAREQLQELAAEATMKYKSQIFNRQKELLQAMKAIKLEHKKKQTAAAAPQEAAPEAQAAASN